MPSCVHLLSSYALCQFMNTNCQVFCTMYVYIYLSLIDIDGFNEYIWIKITNKDIRYIGAAINV